MRVLGPIGRFTLSDHALHRNSIRYHRVGHNDAEISTEIQRNLGAADRFRNSHKPIFDSLNGHFSVNCYLSLCEFRVRWSIRNCSLMTCTKTEPNMIINIRKIPKSSQTNHFYCGGTVVD